ncbi:MAG: dTDP-4-dehydrorhamnose 3,5-epimerase [Myxococcota bacterium]|nr:dTDP-4-dehydrorhamnose 3,5-epimerase [Myxococcota bacterium]
MKTFEQDIPGVVLIEPEVHRDARGFFLESYHAGRYREAGIDAAFVQDNHSLSGRGTVRGLHVQVRRPQAKLIRVLRGQVWDVAVDVRRGSPTFGQHFGVELSAENHRQLYISAGLAHGFAVLSEEAEIGYKCSDFYDPGGEVSIAWNDPELALPWPLSEPTLSKKDQQAMTMAEAMDRLPEWED